MLERLEFTKYDGSSIPVDYSVEEFLGRGIFGNVHRVEAVFGNQKRVFAMKIFDETEDARRAMRNYKMAKEIGLKVFPTYRIGSDRKTVLMTYGNAKNKKLIDPSMYKSNRERLTGIVPEDFRTLSSALFQQADLASSKGVYVHGDSYFFIYDTELGTLDYLIGDLDIVYERGSSRDRRANLANAKGALLGLVSYLGDPNDINSYDEYLVELHDSYDAYTENTHSTVQQSIE